jgi:2-oxoglutarate ferredoxin oxidoreductase subunit beta
VKHVNEAKKAIRKAFEYQDEKLGYTIVELLSTCPTNWGLSTEDSLQWLRDKMIPYYPLGVYKDIKEVRR